MNSLERVFAAVTGKEVDRRPVGLTLSLYGSRLIDCGLAEFYTNADKFVEGQLAVKKMFDTDILFTPFVLTAITEAFGGEVKYFKNAPPNMVKPAFTSSAALIKFDISNIEKHPRMAYLISAARKLAVCAASDTACAAIFISPIDLPAIILGIDEWLETLLFKEDEAKKILEMMNGFFIKMANEFFSSGSHFVALPSVFCNPAIIDQRIVAEIALPVLKESFSRLNGPVVLHHGGAPMNAFLPSLRSLPNVIGFVIDQMDKFDTARTAAGAEKVLLGNIDGPTLNKKTPDKIREQCMKILDNRRGDPHFILTSSGPDIALDTPPENISTIVRTVKDFEKEERV